MKVDGSDGSEDSDDEDWERVVPGTSVEIIGAGAKVGELFVETAQFIPLRLTLSTKNLTGPGGSAFCF